MLDCGGNGRGMGKLKWICFVEFCFVFGDLDVVRWVWREGKRTRREMGGEGLHM